MGHEIYLEILLEVSWPRFLYKHKLRNIAVSILLFSELIKFFQILLRQYFSIQDLLLRYFLDKKLDTLFNSEFLEFQKSEIIRKYFGISSSWDKYFDFGYFFYYLSHSIEKVRIIFFIVVHDIVDIIKN